MQKSPQKRKDEFFMPEIEEFDQLEKPLAKKPRMEEKPKKKLSPPKAKVTQRVQKASKPKPKTGVPIIHNCPNTWCTYFIGKYRNHLFYKNVLLL